MKKELVVSVMFFLSFSFTRAQEIKGTVIDKVGEPLPFANVVELSADSAYISGTTTDDKGRFMIAKATGAAVLKVSYVGCRPVYLSLSSVNGDTDLGEIAFDDGGSALSEVVVTASRPLFKQENGSLFTQVQGTVLSRLTDMDDLLSQLPGAVKGRKGDIEIFGKGAPDIYINKRPVKSKAEVERLRPSDIKNIELITSPGPEYGASGRPVIKITTVDRDEGFSLLSKSDLKQSDYISGGQSVDLGYQFRKLSLAGSLDWQYDHGRLTQPASTELQTEDVLYRYDCGEQRGETREPSLGYQLSADYGIDKDNSLGLSLDGSQYTSKEWRTGNLDYSENQDLKSSSSIDNRYKNKVGYLHVNAFYGGTFRKVSTTLNADFVHNKSDYTQRTTESRQSGPAAGTDSSGDGKQELLAVKSDWKLAFSPETELGWGVLWSYTGNDGNLSTASAGRPVMSDYRTQENSYAVYAELSWKIHDLSLSGGVRYEDYIYKYVDRTDGTDGLRRHYRNLFPSFKASCNVGEWNGMLSFTSQISRPTFRQMSNASYYENEYMYQHGNPQLVPSKLYSVRFYSSYKFITGSVAYTYNGDYIATTFYNNGKDNIIESSYKNYPALQKLDLYLNVQKRWGIWTPSLSIGLIQPFFKYDYQGERISHDKASAYAVLNQFFQLPHDFILSSYIYCNTGGNQGAVELKPYHSVDFGLQKSFLSDRLVVSLQAKDVFHGMKFKEKECIDAIRFIQTEDYHLWNFSLSVTYKLNSKKTRYRGDNSLQSEIKRL